MELGGKVVVITGAAGGIGAALARRFGREAMKVVLADVQAEPLERVVAELREQGIEAHGIPTDVVDPAAVERLAAETIDAFGAVHVVCNNAGVGSVSEGYIWEHDLADWRWGIDVNVLGVVHGIRTFVPLLIEQGEGHVVNTCSGNGSFAPIARGALGGPGTSVYPMTKAAVLSLTESLYIHLALAESSVRVSALFPSGFLNTSIWESWRYRPDEYAPSTPRASEPTTLSAVVERIEGAGRDVAFTPLEDVATHVVEGLTGERFWMTGPPSPFESVIARRAESLAARSQPDYLLGDALGTGAAPPAAAASGRSAS